MRLSELVECVGRVRATSKKLEKVALIADLLRQARDRETELAALYLTGTLPQGRIGLGWRTLQHAIGESAAEGEPLTLADVDRMCDAIAAEKGAGSAERRMAALKALFARASRTSGASWSSCSSGKSGRARWRASCSTRSHAPRS